VQDGKGSNSGVSGNSFANSDAIPLWLRRHWQFAEYPQTTRWTVQA
jgi:hypothetical protein